MSETGTIQTDDDRGSARIELVAAILLGVAGVLTAWAAYNAALTDGDALKGYTQSTTTTADANFFYEAGNQQFSSDSATFLQYALEVERGNEEIALGSGTRSSRRSWPPRSTPGTPTPATPSLSPPSIRRCTSWRA